MTPIFPIAYAIPQPCDLKYKGQLSHAKIPIVENNPLVAILTINNPK